MSFSNLIFLSFFSQVSDFESFIGSLNDQGYLLKKGSRVYQLQTMWEESLWRTFFRHNRSTGLMDLQWGGTSWAELHLAQHWCLLGWRYPWRKLNWEAATGQTDTWYCCLAHPAGLLFQRGLCRAIMHLIVLEERKVCFYTDIITVPRWTHKCQPRNLSWEDDMSCTSSTVVHLKSRNVSRKLWSFMLRQHHFIAVTKWHSTETDLIFCFETWSLKLRFCLKSKSDLKKKYPYYNI